MSHSERVKVSECTESTWLFRVDFCLNFFPQIVHSKSRSVEWTTSTWLFKEHDIVNALGHWAHLNFLAPWTFFLWTFRSRKFRKKLALEQMEHLKFLVATWTLLMWACRAVFDPNFAPQWGTVHGNLGVFSSTSETWEAGNYFRLGFAMASYSRFCENLTSFSEFVLLLVGDFCFVYMIFNMLG